MPVCTTCTSPIQYLYTLYQSEHNLRLEQCANCHSFADPYVEHDTLTILLDLILLKRGVYRHLLFNRGTEPKRETGQKTTSHNDIQSLGAVERERERRKTVLTLGFTLILVDAIIRWSDQYSLGTPNSDERNMWDHEAIRAFSRTLAGCSIETISFHVGITCCCYIVLQILNVLTRRHYVKISAVRRELRMSHIPLTLLYSSLTKLFLLLMLAVWRPEHSNQPSVSWGTYDNAFINRCLDMLNEDNLDRQWVVRNVLGGMAAGFGLRVVLDCHPVLTALVILGGWWFKAIVASAASKWTAGMVDQDDDAWLSYSIP